MTLDFGKVKEIADAASAIYEEIREAEKQKDDFIKEMEKQIKSLKSKESRITSKIKKMFPEEFWTCEIDRYWHKPLHYKIKNVSCSGDKIYITTQDIRKKKPFDGWNGEGLLTFDEFIKIDLYDSYDKALDGYRHRICPHCGDFMGDSNRIWCDKCMDEYRKYLENNERLYYDAEQGRVFGVQPDVDQTLHRYFWIGYDGNYFKLRRLDSGEIIETHNLWSRGFKDNINNYPLIEFIDQSDNTKEAPTQ